MCFRDIYTTPKNANKKGGHKKREHMKTISKKFKIILIIYFSIIVVTPLLAESITLPIGVPLTILVEPTQPDSTFLEKLENNRFTLAITVTLSQNHNDICIKSNKKKVYLPFLSQFRLRPEEFTLQPDDMRYDVTIGYAQEYRYCNGRDLVNGKRPVASIQQITDTYRIRS